jgi:hypothetical protein
LLSLLFERRVVRLERGVVLLDPDFPFRLGELFGHLLPGGRVQEERAMDGGTLGCPMPSHKFQVGDIVSLRRAVSRNAPGGAYKVTKQLPHNGREFEYLIKSASEEHERVAGESALTKL